MANAYFDVPIAVNEPVLSYAPGTPERESLLNTYKKLNSQVREIPMFINGEEVLTDDKRSCSPPHDHKHQIGVYNYGNAKHVTDAINAALEARKKWANMPWESRAAIFLKAADLLAGPYRDYINAATMLAQSKNAMQAEIDAACELADFFRFNVQYMTDIYQSSPKANPACGTVWSIVR
jgi:1-pyrroline-5-carboxylate dehydrogenase